ncbi:MAG: creatininase family protein [Armatimonadota bacterium]
MSKARIMYNMTVKQVREGLQETQTVILPVGVVEQHGYHMPLSVDIHNAQEIARRTSEITGTFVAPTMHYSFSGGTLPGTINISPQLFSLVVMDICRSLVDQGFKNIIILLGHGGTENVEGAKDAALLFQRMNPQYTDITVSVIPFWEMSPTYCTALDIGDFHAAKYETSLMLYWKPELVQMDQATLDEPEFVELMRTDQDAYLQTTKLVDSPYVTPRQVQSPRMKVGVMGNFDGANAEFGRVMCEETVNGLAKFIEEVEGRVVTK